MFKPVYITPKQVFTLKGLGIKFDIIPTIDEVIDWLRIQYNIIIYNYMEPFVDPRMNEIVYCFSVKKCSLRDGWNGRILIANTSYTSDVYKAKREAIEIALNYIINEKKKV